MEREDKWRSDSPLKVVNKLHAEGRQHGTKLMRGMLRDADLGELNRSGLLREKMEWSAAMEWEDESNCNLRKNE